METLGRVRLGILLILLQVVCSDPAESPSCLNGFDSEVFTFTVHGPHLDRGTRLGRVLLRDCAGGGHHVYYSEDPHFQVDGDGTVILKTQLTLHEVQEFSVDVWDSEGQKHTASVRVENVVSSNNHQPVQQDDSEADWFETLLSLQFPKSSSGLRRRKRKWVIPTISVLENLRGTYPRPIEGAKIKSAYEKETKMTYSITGEGVDQPPVGVFTIDKNTGQLFITRPLDREAKASYEFTANAVGADPSVIEDPMNITVVVQDDNDNKPIFTQNPFLGNVPEASAKDYEFMIVNATDADDSINTNNADVRYSIISQKPTDPNPSMFTINPVTGGIRVNSEGLDRENYPEYTLLIQAADREGDGMVATGTAVITVTDSNDNAPQFVKNSHTASVPENKVGAVVVKLPVTDGDEPQSSAWTTKFKIASGNNDGFFSISTGPNKQEGIITTAKALDFEQIRKYTLLVIVENDVPFARPLPTSTATVTVNVLDVNEAPVFDPVEEIISKSEGLKVGTELVVYTATDPDTERNQNVTYRVSADDRVGWVSVDKDTGLIRVKSPMDREAPFVKDGKYKVLILAVDDDAVPATGTGTLVIELKDENDNAPVIEEREIQVCNKDSAPVLLSVIDKDGPGFAEPFHVELLEDSKKNWTARMNESGTGIILTLKTPLPNGDYHVVLRVYDSGDLPQANSIKAKVCDCTGAEFKCLDRGTGEVGLLPILAILGAIFALLVLVLLLLLFMRKKRLGKKEPLINEEDVRDDLYYYDEEGGGEDDQEYDLGILHRGLDNRPGVFRNDEAPTFMAAPLYRPRPTNPEEIGTFIDDNLKAADNDPTAPPYDSLLVYDSEGGGSDAGSLSSLNSSSSGDLDYDCMQEWGPRFKKLADMYGGGDEL